MIDTNVERQIASHNELLGGKSLNESLQAPALQKQLLALYKKANSLPVNSPEYNQALADIRELTGKVKEAKTTDDFLLDQVLTAFSDILPKQ